ncbi:atpase h+ transporting v1 subunit g isoform 1 [Stylonychia lemnae]|uniref:V-type proton ATPase subunit G n=1 Tax=Stylonychia lemnae TaxID=5949 RepID=A0A078AGZ0_STYLE|nr:atpase h+ transporting v1 subunit g isoform 1 [Stylonychia lemnae]CDW80787.1 atpase h+ transporting v1 subunit g isoform 1 [Stylonychia lemnae]|eukprot:CDW77085.1 atpase h+ transporting v1 subunit g isoform 1 [Stylonychia lemnae]
MEQNLQELLKAENEVNKRVSEALQRKNQRLKVIKEEAEKELTQYRIDKEAEYQRELARLKQKIAEEGSADGNQEQRDMDNIQRDFQKNKEIVVDLLVKNVLSVNIEIPKVVKGTF